MFDIDCKDCIYYRSTHRCSYTLKYMYIDIKEENYKDCNHMRSVDGFCKPEAKYFKSNKQGKDIRDCLR